MPRPTSSMQGSNLLVSGLLPQPLLAPKWYRLPLATCMTWFGSTGTLFNWCKADDTTGLDLKLWLGLDRYDQNKFFVLVKDQNERVIASGVIPSPKSCDVEIRLFSETYKIDIRMFHKGSDRVMLRWSFGLEVNDPQRAARIRITWDEFSTRIARLSAEQLRYVNIPRSLSILGVNPSAAARYAFRQSNDRAFHEQFGTQSTGWYLPNMKVTLRYTKFLASPEFMALTQWIETKTITKIAPARPATPPLPADLNDSNAMAEYRLNLRKSKNEPSTVCGHCYDGQIPIEPAQIKKKRSRKEWIGCENGLNCPSDNFWFHLTNECAGLVAANAPKKDVWWCKKCRVNRPKASEHGLERRSRIR